MSIQQNHYNEMFLTNEDSSYELQSKYLNWNN